MIFIRYVRRFRSLRTDSINYTKNLFSNWGQWPWDRIIAIISLVSAIYAISLSNTQFQINERSSGEQFNLDTNIRGQQFRENQKLQKRQFDINLGRAKVQFDSTLQVLKSYQKIADSTLKKTQEYHALQIEYDRATLTFKWDKLSVFDAYTFENDMSYSIKNIGKRPASKVKLTVVLIDGKNKMIAKYFNAFDSLSPTDDIIISSSEKQSYVKYSYASISYNDSLMGRSYDQKYYYKIVNPKNFNFTPCSDQDIRKINSVININRIH